MKKLVVVFLGILFFIFSFSFATDYIFFYGDGNFESEDVEEYFVKNGIEKDYIIKKQDIYFKDTAWDYFMKKVQDYNIPSSKWEMPLLIVEQDDYAKIFAGKKQVMNYFDHPNTSNYLKKVKIVVTKVGDYTRLSSKNKKNALKLIEIIEEKLQDISKGNIHIKIKLYEAIFLKLENIMEKQRSLDKKMLVYYVKINMVIEYLQLISKL